MSSNASIRCGFGGIVLSYVLMSKYTKVNSSYHPPPLTSLFPSLINSLKCVVNALISPPVLTSNSQDVIATTTSPILKTLNIITQTIMSEPESFQRTYPTLFFFVITVSGISGVSIVVKIKKAVWKWLGKERTPLPIRKIQKTLIYGSAILIFYDAGVCCVTRPPLLSLALFVIAGCFFAAPSMWWQTNSDRAGSSLLISSGVCSMLTFLRVSKLLPSNSGESRLAALISIFIYFLVLRGLESLLGVYFVTQTVKAIYNNSIEPVCDAIDNTVSIFFSLLKILVKNTYTHLIKPAYTTTNKQIKFINHRYKHYKNNVIRPTFIMIIKTGKATVQNLLIYVIRPVYKTGEMIVSLFTELCGIVQKFIVTAADDFYTYMIYPFNSKIVDPIRELLLKILLEFIFGSGRTVKQFVSVTHKHVLTPCALLGTRVMIFLKMGVVGSIEYLISSILKPAYKLTLNLLKKSGEYLYLKLLIPTSNLTIECLKELINLLTQLIKSIVYPLFTPLMSLIASYEFGRTSLLHLNSKSNIITTFIFLFASITTGAVSIVLLGRRVRTRGEWINRKGYVILGNGFMKVASVLENLGVFVYTHADCGVLDFVSYVYRKVYPVARRVVLSLSNYIRNFFSAVYDFIWLLVQNVSNGIWIASIYVAKGVKKALKVVFKTIKRTLIHVWRNPVLCLGFCGCLVAVAVWMKENHPEFSFRFYALTKFHLVSGSFGSKIGTLLDWLRWFTQIIITQTSTFYTLLSTSSTFTTLSKTLSTLHTKADKLNFWRWFSNRTFAGITAMTHLTMSRLIRSASIGERMNNFNQRRDEKIGIVASFGRLNTKLIITPVIMLSVFLKGWGVNMILRVLEFFLTPLLFIYLLVYVYIVVKHGNEWNAIARDLGNLGKHNRSNGRGDLMKQIKKYDENGGASRIENRDCVGCLTEVECRVLVCGHQPMCEECLRGWVEAKKRGAGCPVCRHSLFEIYSS